MTVPNIDRTVQKTYEWLHDLMPELGTARAQEAYSALHATLGALRDPLTADEAAQFAAQLPMLVRGMFYEGWDPRQGHRGRTRAAFLADVQSRVRGLGRLDAERSARAVFKVLAKHVSAGEVQEVVNMLPHQVRSLWPDEVIAEAAKRAGGGRRAAV